MGRIKNENLFAHAIMEKILKGNLTKTNVFLDQRS